jgi:hypothetical protein
MAVAAGEIRYGVKLKCTTCNSKTVLGGYTQAQRDSLESATTAAHLAKYPTHAGFSILKSAHASELTHIFKEKTTRVTSGSLTFVDVDATDATIASGSFTAGKKYYIEVSAQVDIDDISEVARMKVVHGSTDFADSVWAQEPNSTSGRLYYNWWTVWTAVSGEAVKLQYARESGASGQNVVGADQITMVAIKLSDDLVENTDWAYNEVTATTSLVTTGDSSSNNAAVTIASPPASSNWLVKTKCRITGTSTTNSTGSRLVRSGEASSTLPQCQLCGEDTTNDMQIYCLSAFYQLSSSNTFTEKGYAVGGNNGTRQSSGVFAFNISKMKQADRLQHSTTETAFFLSTTNFGNAINSFTITPDVTGDWWCYAAMVFDMGSTSTTMKNRLTLNTTGGSLTDQPDTQTSDAYVSSAGWAATDEMPWAIQSMENLTTATEYTITSYASTSFINTVKVDLLNLFAIPMELASTSTPITKLVPETEAITENVTVWMKHVEAKAETEAITEAVNIRMAHREIKTETEAITENVVAKVVMAPRIVNEVENITENVIFRLGRLSVVSETVSVGENVVVKVNRINPPINETEAITENVVVKAARVNAPINETVSIGENIVVKVNRVNPPINETVSIPEQVVVKVSRVNPPVNETEAITEQIVVKAVMAPRIVNETEAVTENVVYRMNMAKVISETESILENVVATVKLPAKTINEVEEITEQVVVKLGLSRVINETVAVPENIVVAVRRVNPPINETVSIGENILVKVNRIEPPVNETVSIPEQIVVQVRNVRPPVNETVGITENVIARLGISRPPIDETVTIPENVVVKVSSTIPPINETVDIGENVVIRMNRITPPVGETVAITENVVVRADRINPPINETVGITENIVAALGIVRPPINEPVSIPENVVVKLQLAYPMVNEQVSISEATVLFKMDRVNPPVNEIMNIPESVIVRMDRIELVGEQLSVSENIIVKLETPITKEVNEIVSISENVTIKVEEQEIFPAPVPGGGVPIRRQPLKITRKQRVWPQMSLKTYDPTKYVKQDRRYDPPTLQEQLSAPRTKVRRAFVGVYDILPLSRTQQRILEEEKQLEQLTQTLNETQELVNVPTLPTELDKLLQKTPQKQKPAKVAKSFVAKYDILSKINKSFTGKYDKNTLVSKTFIASYDIKVFDWGRLQMLQNMRTLVAAMSAMDDLESVDDLDVV